MALTKRQILMRKYTEDEDKAVLRYDTDPEFRERILRERADHLDVLRTKLLYSTEIGAEVRYRRADAQYTEVLLQLADCRVKRVDMERRSAEQA